MIQSKLLDNFLIRLQDGRIERFTKHINKWQMLYLDQQYDTQIHCDIKGRQVGLSNFYKFLATYYFLQNTHAFDIVYYAPNYDMHQPRTIHRNVNNLDITLEKNQQKLLKRPSGKRIEFKTLNNHEQFRKADIIFIDEFFNTDYIKENIELSIEHVMRAPYRKLFIGGSLSTDFKKDAKLTKHINNIPVPITRNFIINDRTNLSLNKFLMLGSDRAIYEYRPDALFDILEDDYSNNFEVLG